MLLLERILRLASDPGDWVLDPCCGSGTTLVAAALLGRHAIGIDRSKQALALARRRLAEPLKTESVLLDKGREAYRQTDVRTLADLGELDLVPVQRNRGIDAILRRHYRGRPVALRVQREGESLRSAAELLARAGASKRCRVMVLVARSAEAEHSASLEPSWPDNVIVLHSPRAQLDRALAALGTNEAEA